MKFKTIKKEFEKEFSKDVEITRYNEKPNIKIFTNYLDLEKCLTDKEKETVKEELNFLQNISIFFSILDNKPTYSYITVETTDGWAAKYTSISIKELKKISEEDNDLKEILKQIELKTIITGESQEVDLFYELSRPDSELNRYLEKICQSVCDVLQKKMENFLNEIEKYRTFPIKE